MSGIVALALRLALIVALYGFLGYAIYTLWLDLRRHGLQQADRRIPEVRLLVRSGDERQEHRYSKPEVVIGRGPACDVRLADRSASALHARLSFHHSQWWIEDLDSSNGTRLNAALLTTPTVLAEGDEIRCGESTIEVGLDGREGLIP